MIMDDNHKPLVPWEVARWSVCGCCNTPGYDGPPVEQRDEKEEAK